MVEQCKSISAKKENPYNLANFLTIIRILLAPIFIYVMETGRISYALILFMIAASTDSLDGYVARHFEMQTQFGKVVDPIADKLLITTAYIVLAIDYPHMTFAIPLWLSLLVIGRDILISSGCYVLKALNKRVTISPVLIGKICTFSQILTVFLAILFNYLQIKSIAFDISVGITSIFTILSGYAYVRMGIKQLGEIPNDS